MSSQFTAVTSCRLDTGITTRKSDITVQIFQLMLFVPTGCCGFFFDFGFAFGLRVESSFVGEIDFLFFLLELGCGRSSGLAAR